jgi:hypothetical protein
MVATVFVRIIIYLIPEVHEQQHIVLIITRIYELRRSSQKNHMMSLLA